MRRAGVESIGCHGGVLFRLPFGGTVVKHGSFARTVGTLNGIKIHFVNTTYLLTAWNGVLPEKLTGSQLVKKFQTFYRPRSFIAAFTSARYLPTFSASSGLSMHPPHALLTS